VPRLLLACFLAFLTSAVWCQPERQLTPEVKAYLFHTVRKSPILERNIGNAFEYSGPIIKLEDGQINYDSIDKILIIDPQLLVIRSELLSKSPKGILTEACNKTAIYEMCQQIAMYNDGAPLNALPLLLKYFTHLFKELPNEFQRGKCYDALLNPSFSPILLTNVAFNERFYIIRVQSSLKVDEFKLLFEAQEKAVNKAIGERTFQLFGQLGGKSNKFESILMAAGDGSYTEGLLRERDRDENGEWNKGLPKAIGLFPYEVAITPEKKPELKTKRISERSLYTYGNNQNSELHFDVWGYNSSNQTTVIVEKGNKQYPLFGSESTRFLTPDSTFSKGITFMKILNDLYQVTHLDLKAKLFGKEGLAEQVNASRQALGDIETAINQKEGELGNLYKHDYTTANKTSKTLRKRKKNGDPKVNTEMQPMTKAKKKAKFYKQSDLVYLYGAYDDELVNYETLSKDYNTLAEEYNAHLNLYNRYKFVLGSNWQSFTEKNGLYTFSDGTTFDIFTQNLTFPPNDSVELVQVRLLSIPEDFEGNKSDEIMMHISMVDAEPFYDADFEVKFQDVFASDAFVYEGNIFKPADTLFLKQLFVEYKKLKLPISVILEGKGIGKWLDSIIIRDPLQSEIPNYPGDEPEARNTSRMSFEFKSLRQSQVQLNIDRGLQIHIASTTDPVKSNLNTNALSAESFMKSNNISRNELLSVLRTRTLIMQLKKELISHAAKYLEQSTAKLFIDDIEMAVNKAKYRVGEKIIKLPKIRD
jgi:hypothetical protein